MTALYRRYLRLLGIDGVPSGLPGLSQIVRRHLVRVPFENVSKLLLLAREGAGRMTLLDEFLDGIEHQDLGGTCYGSNPFLAELLRELGYDAELWGADMSSPDVHACVRVRVAGVAYHVDVGFAAPFRRPMRLDRVPVEIVEGRRRYVLDAVGPDEHRMTAWQGREKHVGYRVHPPARPHDYFQPIIVDSFARGRAFTSCLRIVRFFGNGSAELTDRTLVTNRGGVRRKKQLRSVQEVVVAVHGDLGLPRCPVELAIRALQEFTGRGFVE